MENFMCINEDYKLIKETIQYCFFKYREKREVRYYYFCSFNKYSF